MSNSVPLLDLKLQYETIRDEIDATVSEVIRSQQFVLGPTVESFEAAVAEYTGSPHAVGCASGTDALILALAGLEIGEGDTVVTTPFSFFSTASCAYKVGARPKFVDIDPQTFNIDPDRVEQALDEDVRALLPVHLFGQCASMAPLLEIGRRRGIPVIEDAAQALGAHWNRQAAGSIGRAGCFSFFPTKNLGGFGDGGMIVTADDELAERLRILRVHGGRQMYEHRYVGWNSRLDALQAAVLQVKLRHLDGWSAARERNARRYDEWLGSSAAVASGRVRLPHRVEGATHIFNQYTLRVERRDALREHLVRRGIGHSVYYPVPLHLQECFRDLGHVEGDFPEAERACREVISLPIFPELREDQQERVARALLEFYQTQD